MSASQITNHEEVRDTLLDEFGGCAIVVEIAQEIGISLATARRYLNEMVERGWAVKMRGHGITGRVGADEYTLTDRGVEAHTNNEGW